MKEEVESDKQSKQSTEGESEKADKKLEEEKKAEETTNDGVKILQEVFGKASVQDEVKTKTDNVSFGPVPPSEDEYDEADIKKAEEFKVQGNEFFKISKFDEALDAYSEAIFCNVPPKKKAIYYCNRA